MICVQTRTQILHEPVTVLSGVTIGNFAFWADSILVAVLLYYGANSFKRVTEVKCDNQLPYIFQVGKLASWWSPKSYGCSMNDYLIIKGLLCRWPSQATRWCAA